MRICLLTLALVLSIVPIGDACSSETKLPYTSFQTSTEYLPTNDIGAVISPNCLAFYYTLHSSPEGVEICVRLKS